MSIEAAELAPIKAALMSAIATRQTTPAHRSKKRRRLLAGGAVAFAVIAMAGYTIASHWVGNSAFQDAYRQAQSQLALPPGATWNTIHIPADVRVSTNQGASTAVSIATTKWACYWATAIGQNDSAHERQSAAAFGSLIKNNWVEAPTQSDENATVPNDHPVATGDPSTIRSLRREYRQGLAGNAHTLHQDCKANSPH